MYLEAGIPQEKQMNVIRSNNNGIENPITVVTEILIDKGMPPLPKSIGRQQFVKKR